MLQSLLGVGVVVYFDDILAYNYKNLEGHLKHLKQVFELLRMNKLYANLKKCSFAVSNVVYLGNAHFLRRCSLWMNLR
jgi:hypothetical protein